MGPNQISHWNQAFVDHFVHIYSWKGDFRFQDGSWNSQNTNRGFKLGSIDILYLKKNYHVNWHFLKKIKTDLKNKETQQEKFLIFKNVRELNTDEKSWLLSVQIDLCVQL